jgi:hypothetical protein
MGEAEAREAGSIGKYGLRVQRRYKVGPSPVLLASTNDTQAIGDQGSRVLLQ